MPSGEIWGENGPAAGAPIGLTHYSYARASKTTNQAWGSGVDVELALGTRCRVIRRPHAALRGA
jgi:hypothetical protein